MEELGFRIYAQMILIRGISSVTNLMVMSLDVNSKALLLGLRYLYRP
jgi:hypothetical protein